MPGGKLEEGETLRECVQRECFEELGAIVEVAGLVAMTEKPKTHEGNTVIRFFYDAVIIAKPKSGELDSKYFSQEEIARLLGQGRLRGRDVAHLVTDKRVSRKYIDEPLLFA